jgi:hypothetical protein
LILRNLREAEAKVLFGGFHKGSKSEELKCLEKVVLRYIDHKHDTVSTAEIVRRACKATGVLVEVREERGEFPFYEEEMGGLVERTTICAIYPRKQG